MFKDKLKLILSILLVSALVCGFFSCKNDSSDDNNNLVYDLGYTIDLNGNLVIKDGVTSIGVHMFELNTYIKTVVIPSSVTEIGKYAFNGCTSLTSVTIPSSVTKIGEGAFSGCKSLTSVTIPSSVTEIGDWVFAGCKSLESITIPSSVTEIRPNAFTGCKSLESVTFEKTDGWWFSTGYDSVSGYSIDVSDPQANAIELVDSHCYYYNGPNPHADTSNNDNDNGSGGSSSGNFSGTLSGTYTLQEATASSQTSTFEFSSGTLKKYVGGGSPKATYDYTLSGSTLKVTSTVGGYSSNYEFTLDGTESNITVKGDTLGIGTVFGVTGATSVTLTK